MSDQIPLTSQIRPGLNARVELTVTEADTALSLGSGDVPVLATPRLVCLCEAAAIDAIGTLLGKDQTSVGMRVQIDHLAPTLVGGVVQAEATLEKIEGRRLTFTVSARNHRSLIAAGRVTRAVVSRESFLSKAAE